MSTLTELYITMENLSKLNRPNDEALLVDPETPVYSEEYEYFELM